MDEDILKIDPLLKPLHTDLKKLFIGQYLLSSEFDRYITEMGLCGIWEAVINAYGYDITTDREEILISLLNLALKSSQEEFESISTRIIQGFFSWSNLKLDLRQIFIDLKLAGLSDKAIKTLHSKWEYRNIILTYGNKTDNNNPNISNQKKIEPHELIESNKTSWRSLFSKGKVYLVFEEIINFAHEIRDAELEKNISILSNRWHQIKDDHHKGIIREEERELKINKVNEALIDLILNLGS